MSQAIQNDHESLVGIKTGILNYARRRPLLRQSLIRTIKLKPQKERSLRVDRYFSVFCLDRSTPYS